MGSTEGDEGRRPRPRVVDKRVSARSDPGSSAPPPPPRRAPEAPPEHAVPDASPEREALWTPEQEAQAQRMAQEVLDTPSEQWVLNAAVTLANVAATKLDGGESGDAQLAIDALVALVDGVGSRLGSAEAPLRQTVAQLQMAFAQGAEPPPP
jgi:hypothetical protein